MNATTKRKKAGKDIRLAYVRSAAHGLEQMGADFKIIFNGSEFGKYKSAFPLVHKGKVKKKLAYGALIGYARPFYAKTQPGDMAVIPPGKFNVRKLRSSVVSDLSKRWGKGRHSSSIVKGEIHIIRIPVKP